MKIPAMLRAMRPHQWSKNVFVLAALGFAYGDQSVDVTSGALTQTLIAFAAFCLGSSAVYLLNDVVDVESDRAHPTKCRRPIAAGELSISFALAFALVCALAALALGVLVGGSPIPAVAIVGMYMGVNLAYSFKLKHVVLVDAFCIAIGFLFRVKVGGIAAGIEISQWMMLCTLFLALFLALNKRRFEIQLLGDDRGSHRAILDEYDPGFLDQMVTVLAACTIVCYTMYTVDEDAMEKFAAGKRLIWSVPFVVFGVARYMFLVQTGRGGGSPTKIFLGADAWFLVNLLAWVSVVGFVFYGA